MVLLLTSIPPRNTILAYALLEVQVMLKRVFSYMREYKNMHVMVC